MRTPLRWFLVTALGDIFLFSTLLTAAVRCGGESLLRTTSSAKKRSESTATPLPSALHRTSEAVAQAYYQEQPCGKARNSNPCQSQQQCECPAVPHDQQFGNRFPFRTASGGPHANEGSSENLGLFKQQKTLCTKMHYFS